MRVITPELIKELESLSKKMRLKALEMAFNVGKKGAHLGGGLSAIEIFATLYGCIMDLKDPQNLDNDKMVLSKGHAVLAYYPALYYAGFLTKEDLDSFEQNDTTFHGHASRNLNKGIDFSGGSLGMGFSFSVGLALALKKRQSKNHVYVVVGDGECDEGIIWEASQFAAHYKLDNITLIVDKNDLQYDGPTESVLGHGSLKDKFKAFGWTAYSVDGHSVKSLIEGFNAEPYGKPKVIIAQTIKGKGVSFMENNKEWHHRSLTKQQYDQAIEEIEL